MTDRDLDREPLPRDLERDAAERPEHVMVRFMSRLMTGYETAHRTIVEQGELANQRMIAQEKALSRSLDMQLKLFEQLEDMMNMRNERETKALAARQDRELKGVIVQDLRALATLAVKKYAGIPLTGDDSHGLQDLIATFTGEQLDAAMSGKPLVLTDGQRELLVGILQSLAEQEEKAKPKEDEPKAAE